MKTRYVIGIAACALSIAATAAQAASLAELSGELTQLVRKVSPSVVELRAQRSTADLAAVMSTLGSGKSARVTSPTRTQSVGSGFVIDSDGYILTTANVVANSKELSVKFADGSQCEGEVAGSDPITNTAVIRVKKAGLKALEFGDSDRLEPGALVVTINSQAGMQNTASLGMVAGLGRQFDSAGDMFQISGTIGPGASGGPVLDASGEVVGVTSAMLSPSASALPFNIPQITLPGLESLGPELMGLLTQYHRVVAPGKAKSDSSDSKKAAGTSVYSERFREAMAKAAEMGSRYAELATSTTRTSGSSGFAIPINRLKPILGDLKEGRKVEYGSIGAQIRESGGKAVFGPIIDGSPSAKAGIKNGDTLISADGRKFESLNEFTAYVRSHRPGDKIRIVVGRGDTEMAMDVAVVKWSGIAARKAPAAALLSSKAASAGRPVSLALENASIGEVAKALSSASGKSVIVTEPERITKKVTLQLKSTTLEKALEVICRTLECKYTKDEDTYVISRK